MATANATLGEIIGHGSFGKVFKATLNGEPVAVKVISIASFDQKEKDDVMKELNVLKNFSHPNVVEYKGAMKRITSGNVVNLYIYMELCVEGDLYRAIQSQRAKKLLFSERKILDYCNGITSAIQYVHSNNIIHKDIKPQNIFLHRGSIKLGDFGLSKLLQLREDCNDSVLQIPLYACPETIFNRYFSKSGDMWSLGCTLYELIILERPFNNIGDILKFSKDQFKLKPIPSEYSSMERVLNLLIQFDPAKRPTASQILKMI